MLRECFRELRKDAAAGIDKVTKEEYNKNLNENLKVLVGKLQMIKLLGHRMADKRVLRYVKRFIKAGIMEEGKEIASDKGTPQGGLFHRYSPISICITVLTSGSRECFSRAVMVKVV
jgi:hypothetical protein